MGKKTGDYPTSPVRLETLIDYAQEIFKPIKKGECVTLVWIQMAGRRMHTKYLLANQSLFSDAIGDLDRHLLVYIEPLDLTKEDLVGYLGLIGRTILEECRRGRKDKELRRIANGKRTNLFSNESVSYTKLLYELKELLASIFALKKEVVLFFGELDELSFVNKLFFKNLRSLWDSFRPKLHYVFLVREDITGLPKAVDRYQDLYEVIAQNVVYVPLLDAEDVDYIIELNEERLGRKFSALEKEVLKEVCGNHPFLLKIGCREVARFNGKKLSRPEMADKLLSHSELRGAIKRILAVRLPEEEELLKKIATEKVESLPKENILLEEIGLVKKDGRFQLASRLMQSCLLEEKPKVKAAVGANPGKLVLDQETGTVLFGDVPVDEGLTRQEYEVLLSFLRGPSRIHSRDDIGKVLWGENVYEKYSDWAIDQLMSKLRKKLQKLGLKKNCLATIRGRGYKFSQNT